MKDEGGRECWEKQEDWLILICLGIFEKQAQQLVFGRKSHFNFYASYKTAFA